MVFATTEAEDASGHLTRRKMHIVSNSQLTKSCLSLGINRYIIFDTFTSKKWKPRIFRDSVGTDKTSESSQSLSTKTLADVGKFR